MRSLAYKPFWNDGKSVRLENYPAGTRIRIGGRLFCKEAIGTFWSEGKKIRTVVRMA